MGTNRFTLEEVLGDKALQGYLSTKTVLIFSGEHQAYWRDHGCGYAMEPEAAGHYVFDDAFRRTSHSGSEKQITFVVSNAR